MEEAEKQFWDEYLEQKLQYIFSDLAETLGYHERVFSLRKNYSQKGTNAGKLISTVIEINEESYPYDVHNKIAKVVPVLLICPNKSYYEFRISTATYNDIPLPNSVHLKKDVDDKDTYVNVLFEINDDNMWDYLVQILAHSLDSYNSSNSFGCCSRYAACSDAGSCIHPNKLYAKGCQYRKNLEKGNVFYKEKLVLSGWIKPDETVKKKRSQKGSSLIQFPESYVVIDIETTGLSPEYDEIIELAAIKVSDNEIVDTFSSLVKPTPDDAGRYVDSYITSLTGITNEMLSDAPALICVLPKFRDFIGSEILIAHNANFDINFIYDYSVRVLDKPLCNDFIDTMRLSRRLYPEIRHHRLQDLCKRYAVDTSEAHRALSDCKTTLNCYRALMANIIEVHGSLEAFKVTHTTSRKHKLCAADIVANSENINPYNPLYGNVFVFTGVLEKMTRKEAMQIVVNNGGVNGDRVTRDTNFLILGNNDYCKTIKDGKSNKQKKAEALKLAGHDIEIIPENVFYDMLDETY